MRRFRLATVAVFLALVAAPVASQERQAGQEPPLPSVFDLRSVGAVTPIKQQKGGTCWTHGTMAAIESNLLISGVWKKLSMNGEPACSEYHLDWWNGFNKHRNDDIGEEAKDSKGLTVHVGGDYRVSAAYLSRGDGIVLCPLDKEGKPDPTSWFKETPPYRDPAGKRFYVRDIEWFVMGDNLEGIDVIKRRIMAEGALGTAYTAGRGTAKDFVHYQAPDNPSKPNHAVAIVGWDDEKISGDKEKAAPKPGAWLIKNSWGTKKGDQGYYWISYYDKVCCRDPEMGAVSFRNIELMKYDHVYAHDYHGWRGTLKDVNKAFNAYTAVAEHAIPSVSFYTAKDNVGYTVKIYRRFDNGKLEDEVASKAGSFRHTGFHTVDLERPVQLKANDRFYVCLDLTDGGQPIDRTSEIPVLLGQEKQTKPVTQEKQQEKKPVTPEKQPEKKPETKPGAQEKPPQKKQRQTPIVLSKANPCESYYWDGSAWRDLYDHRFENPPWGTFDRTANFCMKALAVRGGPAAATAVSQ